LRDYKISAKLVTDRFFKIRLVFIDVQTRSPSEITDRLFDLPIFFGFDAFLKKPRCDRLTREKSRYRQNRNGNQRQKNLFGKRGFEKIVHE
jgi:hypothetical protein